MLSSYRYQYPTFEITVLTIAMENY